MCADCAGAPGAEGGGGPGHHPGQPARQTHAEGPPAQDRAARQVPSKLLTDRFISTLYVQDVGVL